MSRVILCQINKIVLRVVLDQQFSNKSTDLCACVQEAVGSNPSMSFLYFPKSLHLYGHLYGPFAIRWCGEDNFFLPPHRTAGIRTHVSRVAPTRDLLKDAQPTELPHLSLFFKEHISEARNLLPFRQRQFFSPVFGLGCFRCFRMRMNILTRGISGHPPPPTEKFPPLPIRQFFPLPS